MKAEKCDDKNCIVHKNLIPRGRSFVGIVVSTKMQKTASVEWEWKRKIPKFERYEEKITRIKAHNSPCVNAKKGDRVLIMECRPLSKTKNFVIVKVLGKDISYLEKEEQMEESKTRKIAVNEGVEPKTGKD